MALQELSVTIPIPESHVIITKTEYEELLKQEVAGKYWDFKTLENRVQRKRDWIEEKILYKPSFRKILDVNENPNGFVKYPSTDGRKWSFLASKMNNFLEENFPEIMRG
ncbi:DUF771 domain-containing protein [Listeria monocytogenes]|uniref:DUF771 domain-containing protein n=1 Tax=Listeria monocytogenes TaxID=1639 RepID=UPI00043460E6|nr:DUF771 domain-containing protein [Listeria monocytogenes]EAA0100599.1 DUF771 domain-containing protein [Listeria monocytogenes]EAC4160623.1 DUF771 domain-containing protein [Listeria monocytogenes]EAC5700590.1 DUF771 domain-containing protein [Listeria monocytogenes]EAC6044106.1 DUF771 domain-containing protein [Listeria monocytogenes]EAC6053108.1 DUF771 domain-containing protein [Listeria monocytogenes]